MGDYGGSLKERLKNGSDMTDTELAKYGVLASTVAPDVIEGFVKNTAITSAIDVFIKDYEGLTGEGKTMSDC